MWDLQLYGKGMEVKQFTTAYLPTNKFRPYKGFGGSISINNTFSVNGNLSSAVAFLNYEIETHRGISIGDTNISPKEISWTQPTIPGKDFGGRESRR
jgi:hypothetical protein